MKVRTFTFNIFSFLLLILPFIGWGQEQFPCDAEAAFSYDMMSYCQNGDDPVVTVTGDAGNFSYNVLSGGPDLALNSVTGDVDVSESDPGEYEVINTVAGGGGGGCELPSDLIITGVFDGPYSGGLPKGVELYVVNDIPDLSIYGLGSANNGGGTDGEEFTFPADAASAGQFIYVASESANFTTWFGFAPDYTDGAVNINGDDAIELFKDGSVVDVFGDINQDGTNQPWDHVDGWAHRVSGTGPDGSTFVLANWTFSGPNAWDDDAGNTNATATPPFPVASYGSPCGGGCDLSSDLILTGVFDGPYSGGLPKGVELFVANDIPDLSIYGLGSANNGGGTDGEEFTFPADAASAGQFIYVASESANFTTWFGFAPDYTDGAVNINGDDAIELFKDGSVVDVFGDINQDGTNQPWDHVDGWAHRVSGTGPDGSTFVLANWSFSGPNAWDDDGGNTNATATPPFPVANFGSPCGSGDSDFTCSQEIEILPAPQDFFGGNIVVCGLDPQQLFGPDFNGTWSGGAGSFSNPNEPFTTYTPDPSELGTTVEIIYDAETNNECGNDTYVYYLTFIPEPDAEFSYDADEYCPNGDDPVITILGMAGIFSYVANAGGPILGLDPETGEIDLTNTDQGTYTVTNTVSGCGNLVISGVVDGPITGGIPKAVEFTAVEDIPDLSVYGWGSANNGDGSDGIEFTFPQVSLSQGEHVWVASETPIFTDFFGFPPNYTSGAALINGDDAIELFCNGQVIDVFGDINVDGSSEPWEYTDSWAYRNSSTGPDGPIFVLGNWFFGGPNNLDGADNNDNAEVPMPIGTFFSTVGGTCPDDEFSVTITIEDDEAPELTCPGNITINLDPGLCSAIVNFNVTAVDNCDPNPVITQIDDLGLGNGDEFEIGQYELEFTVEDIFGNSNSCSFSVTINEFANPTSTLTCNDNVQVSLDEDGCSIVGADMILEGGPYGCYDDYIVDVVELPGSPNNQVCCSEIGGPWTVMVEDPDTGNKCWGSIIVEDKLSPVFDCPEQDVEISCEDDIDNVPPPLAIDNCTFPLNYQLVDENFIDEDACDDNAVRFERIWLAIDEYGNESALCSQVIALVRPDDIDFPDDREWECSDYDQFPNIIEATEYTGLLFNTGSGIPEGIDGLYCQYDATFVDELLETCGTSFKIVRTWTVLDWCTNSIITSNDAGEDNIQVIKVLDTTDPVITMENYEVSANIPGEHPQPCNSQDFLPPANVTDACNTWTLRIYTPIGEANYVNGVDGTQGGIIPSPGLELGFHTITYEAEDACGNIATLDVTIEVVDDIAPTAICDEITEVTLSSQGEAIVPADVFDDGSYDNCCLDEFLARRMDGDCNGNFDDFDPTVEFCCEDVPNSPIMVVFRVVDCYGNANDCMVEVYVDDKIPPITTFCPENETITCEEYVDDLAAALDAEDYSVLEPFGQPEFLDNCTVNIEYNVSVNIDNCQEGTIVRSWTASDDNPQNATASCTQTIFVEHVSDWVVEFPADIDAECTDGTLPDFGEPEIYFDECELIGVSHEDEYFYVVPDACYKIVRTWTAINWCIYEDFGFDAYSEASSFEAAFFVDWDGDGDLDERTFRDGWNTTGAPGTPDGYIVYEQTIKVSDNEAPEFVIPEIDGCIVDTDCNTDITIPYPDILDQCSPSFVVNITIEDVDGNVVAEFDDYQADAEVTLEDKEPGEYTLFYEVTDDCGNTSFDSYDLLVEDCKLPTPYCLNGIVVEIMQTNMIEVWASDLDAGSFDNCPGDLIFSFSPDVTDLAVTYTCNNLGPEMVEIWVTDANGNQDFCETVIFVQDNMGHCDGVPVALGGMITTEEDETVMDVMVDMNGGQQMMVTGADGLYDFNDLAAGADYTITPMLDEGHLNGVSTYDMVLISMHVLGLQPLDSPYKMIAADVNNSESISTLDLVALQKVILLLEDGFPNNTSWRFVDADYAFPNPANPWQEAFPEVLNYNDLNASDLEADFTGVKIGDVNGSVQANLGDETGNRTNGAPFRIELENRNLEAGETVLVPFRATEAELYGYQFTLEFDPAVLELADVREGLAVTENFGLRFVDEGVITTNWSSAFAEDLTDTELFTLAFRVKTTGQLDEVISLSPRHTPAEAYHGNDSFSDVQLYFDGQAAATDFALYQNVPNPFRGTTTIGFFLPEASDITLRIMDVSGKELKVFRGDYGQGYHEVRVTDLVQSGVLYYQLQTGTFSATRKMVVQQ